MSSNDPNRRRVSAAQALVAILDAQDQAAVMDFQGVRQTFTSDHDLLNQAIDGVGQSGSTPLYSTLIEAVDLILAEGVANPVIVALTDGEAGDGSKFDDVVIAANANQIPIFPVGLGTSVDFTQLQALAQQTGGTFASALDANQLQVLFENLGVAVRAGRIIVHASGAFLPPLQSSGTYTLSGSLITRIQDLAIDSPFSFQFDVLDAAP